MNNTKGGSAHPDEIDSPTARADSSAWQNLALVGHRRREETPLVGPYCSAQGTYSKQCACFLQHPLIINQHDAAARCRRNHGTKGVGHERAPLSLIVTTTHSPEQQYSCRLLACLSALGLLLCLPCCTGPGSGPHVSTNESCACCCTAQRRATPRAANPMGLGEERPPPFTTSLCERRHVIGFRVRLQIVEALLSSRFSCMQLRMVMV